MKRGIDSYVQEKVYFLGNPVIKYPQYRGKNGRCHGDI